MPNNRKDFFRKIDNIHSINTYKGILLLNDDYYIMDEIKDDLSLFYKQRLLTAKYPYKMLKKYVVNYFIDDPVFKIQEIISEMKWDENDEDIINKLLNSEHSIVRKNVVKNSKLSADQITKLLNEETNFSILLSLLRKEYVIEKHKLSEKNIKRILELHSNNNLNTELKVKNIIAGLPYLSKKMAIKIIFNKEIHAPKYFLLKFNSKVIPDYLLFVLSGMKNVNSLMLKSIKTIIKNKKPDVKEAIMGIKLLNKYYDKEDINFKNIIDLLKMLENTENRKIINTIIKKIK